MRDFWKQTVTGSSTRTAVWLLKYHPVKSHNNLGWKQLSCLKLSHILISWFLLQCFPWAGLDWNQIKTIFLRKRKEKATTCGTTDAGLTRYEQKLPLTNIFIKTWMADSTCNQNSSVSENEGQVTGRETSTNYSVNFVLVCCKMSMR